MNIKAINQELAKIGYKAVKLPKPKNRALAWKPQTAGGRACRAAMLYWASLPPIGDYSKPCADTLLRFFGYRGVSGKELGGFTPKGLWIASIAKHYARQIDYKHGGQIGVFGEAIIQTKITTTQGMRTYKQMNIGVFPRTPTAQHA
jgi:hypothetical protein